MMRAKREPTSLRGVRDRPIARLVAAMSCCAVFLASYRYARGSLPADAAGGAAQLSPRSLLSALAWRAQGPSAAAVEQLLSASTAVHGWVNKTGAVDLRHWHSSFEKDRREAFQAWFADWSRRQRGGGGGEGGGGSSGGGSGAGPDTDSLPQVIIPPCQIFVNHDYRFLYIRLPKTGSTSLVKYLTECEFPRHGPACVQRLSGDTPPYEVERLFREYFVFTLVRNPYTRALSSYKYVISKMRAEPASCTRGLSWDAFAREPMAPGARCRTEPECCTQSAGFFWHHVSRQSRCMLAGDYTFSSLDGSGGMDGPSEQGGAGGGGSGDGGSVASGVGGGVAAAGAAAAGSGPRWALDYIGRMEHMAEDLEEILQEIDRRRDPSMPALAGGMQKERELKKRNAVVVCTEGGAPLAPVNKTGPGGMVYLAAQPQEQYCQEEQMFTGEHAASLAGVQRLYRQDIELLYSGIAPIPGGSSSSSGGSSGVA